MIINGNRKHQGFLRHNKLPQIVWLKETLFCYLTVLVRSPPCDWILCSGYCKAKMLSSRAQGPLLSTFLLIGRIRFFAVVGLRSCFFVDCWPEVAPSDLWLVTLQFLHVTPLPSKPAVACRIFLCFDSLRLLLQIAVVGQGLVGTSF